jgi:SAM-dependent methyltransferase
MSTQPADIAQYDRIGALYQRFKETAALPIPERDLFVSMLGDPHGLDVIDLACGYGRYTRLVRELGARRAVGVDISAAMVDLARAQTPTGAEDVTFVCHDVTTVPQLGSFDVATAVWLFNYADSEDELSAMLAGARRNLAAGGRLVAITVHPDFVPGRTDWEPYGLRTDHNVEEPRRHRMHAELLTPDGAIPIEISRWDADVYTEAAGAAGFTGCRWILPLIPPDELDRRGADFWHAYLDNPFVAGFHARANGPS